MQAWKNVIGDTQQGAKRLYESVSSGLGRSADNNHKGKSETTEGGEIIQMENVEEVDGGGGENNGTKMALRNSSKEDNKGSSGENNKDKAQQLKASGTPIEATTQASSHQNGDAMDNGDDELFKEADITNEQFMYALRKRLKEAQKTERELAELKKKYLEASVTSEQLVIMLGRVSIFIHI